MANRQGLVAVKRMATRDGRTYMTTVWVRPQDAAKAGNSHVAIPDWHFKNEADLVAEVERIHKIKDISERNVLKDHMLADLKANGITWKEDNGSKADAVNWMRAMMAAKKHLNSGKEIKIVHKTNGSGTTGTQPPAPAAAQSQRTPIQAQPATQSGSGKVVLGTGQPMSKEDAKKAIQELQKRIGTQAVMDLAEKNGIQWAKNPNHIANSYMQCAMKLSKHLQNGGTLTDTGATSASTAQSNAAPASAALVQPPQPAGPKPMTLEWDYHHATPKQKLIGVVTGIIPTDDATTQYLETLMKQGVFDLKPTPQRLNPNANPVSVKTGYQHSLPKAYYRAIERINNTLENDYNAIYQQAQPNSSSDEMFKGTPYEKMYNDYKAAYRHLYDTYGYRVYNQGTEKAATELKTLELLKDLAGQRDIKDVPQTHMLGTLETRFKDAAKDPQKAQQIWDDLDLDILGEGAYSPEGTSAFKNVFQLCSNGSDPFWDFYNNSLTSVVASTTSYSNARAWSRDIKAGVVNKQDAVRVLADALQNMRLTGKSSAKDNVSPVTRITQMNHQNISKRYIWDELKNDTSMFDIDKAISDAKDCLKAWEPLQTDDGKYIRDQIFIQYTVHSYALHNNLKGINDFKPINKDEWALTKDKKMTIEDHIHIMRKTGKAREKSMAVKQKQVEAMIREAQSTKNTPATPDQKRKKLFNTDFLAEWRKGTDPTKLEFPEYDDIKHYAKCSLDKVPDAELKKIESRIHATHDNVNHRSFKTKVNGAYRIKNLPFEEEFKKIDAARNNTGFYYHGTDFKATQLILGQSGQFVVKPRAEAKAGRMLGDGVYLAEQSSKSMQYVGGQYVPGGVSSARGVLFVCKASLGKVVESTKRGYEFNQPLLNKKENDTLAMLRPHVINPEWAVKEEKAVMPRLWIDVERV
jgi:hypothetical protein